jgi:transcriptional regulator with XRE-family HTH domain
MSGRIDTARLREALDGQRRARNLSWRQVAGEANVSPSLLSRMSNGHRPDLDGFIALVQWLGSPAEDFMVQPGDPIQDHSQPALEAQMGPLLRARSDFNETEQNYLLEIMEATIRRIRAERQARS